MPELDQWLAQLFDPENVDGTVAAMVDAAGPDDATEARLEAARRKLADCDERLGKYRAALDRGADPIVVAGWISEVQGERLVAEAELATASSEQPSEDELRRIVEGLGDMARVLRVANGVDRAAVYAGLGLTITYRPDLRLVVAEARPPIVENACATECVGGGT